MRKSVLVINDDLDVCKQIKYNLQNESTDVYYARTVHEGLQNFMKQNYTLVIMDIAFSEADGMELLETMRRSKTMPILVLSSKCDTQDRVQALNAGADDFLSHPFDITECLARARALMRRYTEFGGTAEQCYTLAFGPGLIIEPQYRSATLKGERMNLTRKEFDMLYYLALNAGQVLTRDQIYNGVWQLDEAINVDETVRFHIKELRKKLETSGAPYIETVWGVGYRFTTEQKDEKNET